MPNYNDAQAVADLLSQFDFNIINEGPGDFSTQHRKYTCEFSKPGIESFTTTYQSNPDVHGQPTATDVFAALASDALAVDGLLVDTSASLTIAGWNQKLDDSLWALDFEDRNGVPPQLSDWLARDAEGEKGNESAKTSPVSLKTAAKEARAVSTKLSENNGGTDDHDGKDDLQLHMIPSEMHIPSQNDHHRAPSLSDIAAETRAASAAMETNIASRIDRERDAR